MRLCRNCFHAQHRLGLAHNCLKFVHNEEGRFTCQCPSCSGV